MICDRIVYGGQLLLTVYHQGFDDEIKERRLKIVEKVGSYNLVFTETLVSDEEIDHITNWSLKEEGLLTPDSTKNPYDQASCAHSNISRLLSRKAGNGSAKVQVTSGKNTLKTSFNLKTKNWDAEVVGAQAWEKQLADLTSTFIPAKEILSNSKNLVNAINVGNVDFDDTYKDIISIASVDISRGPNNVQKKKYLQILQDITDGKVKYENEEFYLLPGSQAKLEFQLVAEGMRKIALLWQLIKNGTLEQGTVLFWDEPEANINPKHIPALVEILLNLQADGVQILIATHDYVLAKYLEIKTMGASTIRFHSLYKKEGRIEIESNSSFKDLANNSIAEAFNTLLDEVFEQTTKG